MFNDMKTKVVSFVNNPNTKTNVKEIATYAAQIATYGLVLGVIGGIAAVVQNKIIAASVNK